MNGTAELNIIHTLFGLNQTRLAALKALGEFLHSHPEMKDEQLLLAHRILATGEPDGIHKGPTQNTQSDDRK